MKNSQNIEEQILDLMRRDDSADASIDSVKWAKNLFRTRLAESKASIGQRILAVLQMDIAPNRPAFGERSGGTGQSRQMLFEAGENSIDLRVKSVEGGFEIHGQILGDGFEGGSVELSGDATYSADMNEMSEFKLAGVASGSYILELRGDGKELAVEGLEIS